MRKKKRGCAIAVMPNGERVPVSLTNKGIAIVAAIKSGLLPRVKGGWDDTKFNKFWDKYEQMLAERDESLFRASLDNIGQDESENGNNKSEQTD